MKQYKCNLFLEVISGNWRVSKRKKRHPSEIAFEIAANLDVPEIVYNLEQNIKISPQMEKIIDEVTDKFIFKKLEV